MPNGGNPAGQPNGSGQPSGAPGGGQPPDMPGAGPGNPGSNNPVLTIAASTVITNNGQSATITDIQIGDTLTITFGPSGKVTSIDISPDSSSSSGSDGTAATTLATGTYSSVSYSSSNQDENALRIDDGAQVTLSDATVSKTGDTSSTDNSDFYGLNAAVLVLGTLTENGSTITSNASGANGILVNGSGNAELKGTTINTVKDNSGGIDATGGGTITATGLSVATKGNSSAAIRSDRGGGTINVTGGTFQTAGVGSPAIYSTANISTESAVLSATGSEAVVIEGMNSVKLANSTVSGNMTSSAGGSGDNLHTVMIYQSMSGDSQTGQGTFSMTGGSLTSKNGDVFYVTNTSASISLSGVSINNHGGGNLLTVSGNDSSRGWGTAGSNGGRCEFDTTSQTLSGDITVDSISSLNLNLDKSTFAGAINSDGAAGSVNVTMTGSSWRLTSDSYVTSFTGHTNQIVTNGHHVFVNGQKLV